ncbi:MAG: radical SAM protein [Desulfovibrionaceae bacterium]|nr:radical SAM protein [Desulfovibrionaceae bacterium]
MQRYKYIYGPVLSRRLGRSLGVDVIPFKTCSYDCVYCLLGRTTRHTTEVREYVPAEDVLDELARKLAEDRPDAISFAGSGEPTLNSRLGEIISGIKAMTDVPVVVFTNSSLLWMPEVRAGLAGADIVSPSLDAVLPDSAEAVNRLAPGLDVEKIFGGLQTFCREFRGRIWLEVLLAAGINDRPQDIEAIAKAVARLDNIECTQLNTVVRPPAEKHVGAVGRRGLERIAARLPGRVEIIAPFFGRAEETHSRNKIGPDDVAGLVERHPSTLEGIAEGLDSGIEETAEIVRRLVSEGVLVETDRDGKAFYIVPHPDGAED